MAEIYMEGGLSKSCEGHDVNFRQNQPFSERRDPTFLLARFLDGF